MNLFTKQKYRHRCRKQKLHLAGDGRGVNGEIGTDVDTLQGVRQVTSQNLLYS